MSDANIFRIAALVLFICLTLRMQILRLLALVLKQIFSFPLLRLLLPGLKRYLDEAAASPLPESERVKQAIDALEQGELPAYVHQRIAEQDQHQLPWTSNFSIADLLLARRYNIKPLGMVIGTAHYQMGMKLSDLAAIHSNLITPTYAIPQIDNYVYKAAELALERLSNEAILHGAHAVLNINVKYELPELESDQIIFTFIGTAVSIPALPTSTKPYLMTLNLAEATSLIESGATPLSFIFNISSHFEWRNTPVLVRDIETYEHTQISNAISLTRKKAIVDLREKIQAQQADGMLAQHMTFSVRIIERTDANDKRIYGYLSQFIDYGCLIASNHGQAKTSISPTILLS